MGSKMKPKSGLGIMKVVNAEDIKRAEQVLVDNGIEEDEADIVLQAIGYVLLNKELYDEGGDLDA